MIPDKAFYEALGRPPWSHDAILSELKARGVTRVMPIDQHALGMGSAHTLEAPVGIIGKIRGMGIIIDLGDGEKLC